MKRNFNEWLSGFRDSIADYGYYIDFEKVHRNVDSIKVELNILNSLIGSKNIEVDFENLMKKYPEVLKCIPLLLAVRANEIYCQDENGGHLFQFNFGKYPPNCRTDDVAGNGNDLCGSCYTLGRSCYLPKGNGSFRGKACSGT